MPVRITSIENGSLAEELGWKPGDQIVAVNGETVEDELDFRFKTAEEALELRVRMNGNLEVQHVTKDIDDAFGAELQEFRIKTCGDDCLFCFVDQNPVGLRDTLYFRDGDFRMSFLYGNYITVTNLRERNLKRIVEQGLSPMYISVHCTDDAIRREIMGHRTQNDRLMEKLWFFHEHGIEMHAQIVLVPNFNDAGALIKTILDLYELHERLYSVSVVPVGLTRHRRELTKLRTVSQDEAKQLVRLVKCWQPFFRERIGRGFLYLSDEVYILADEEFPHEEDYDGYPLMENGVGLSRDFLNELEYQKEEFPSALPEPRRLTIATGTLAAPLLEQRIVPALRKVNNLDVSVIPCENTLFGDSVTVSGLLNFKSLKASLAARVESLGDLVLLPPDSVNFEGLFLDNRDDMATPEQLGEALGGVPVQVFKGDWVEVLEQLAA